MAKKGNTISTLNKSRVEPNDEIYTHIDEVKEELRHYTNELKDKIIYCNCDDFNSAFFKYFVENFQRLGIKFLYCTAKTSEGGLFITYDGKKAETQNLKGDGSFLSTECIGILKVADVIITNPPFTLIHEFIDLMVNNGKKYLIIGPVTAVGNRHLDQLKNGELGYGYKDSNVSRMKYRNTEKTYGNHCWLTNMQGDGDKPKKLIKKEYNAKDFSSFDNSDVLLVPRGDKIPYNYDGVIAVSKTFVVGMYNPYDKLLHIDTPQGEVKYKIIDYGRNLKINGENVFDKILIQKIN